MRIDTADRRGMCLWAQLIRDEDEEYRIELCGDFLVASDDATTENVEYALEEFDDLLDLLSGEDPTADSPRRALSFVLTTGIGVNQPFLVDYPWPKAHRHWTDCGYEYDVEVEAFVLQRPPLTDEADLILRLMQEIRDWEHGRELHQLRTAHARRSAQPTRFEAAHGYRRVGLSWYEPSSVTVTLYGTHEYLNRDCRMASATGEDVGEARRLCETRVALLFGVSGLGELPLNWRR